MAKKGAVLEVMKIFSTDGTMVTKTLYYYDLLLYFDNNFNVQ